MTAGRHLVFPFLAVFLLTTKPEKSIADNITAAGVFWRHPKPVEKRLFTQTKPMCELVEGIVTAPLSINCDPVFMPRRRDHSLPQHKVETHNLVMVNEVLRIFTRL